MLLDIPAPFVRIAFVPEYYNYAGSSHSYRLEASYTLGFSTTPVDVDVRASHYLLPFLTAYPDILAFAGVL